MRRQRGQFQRHRTASAFSQFPNLPPISEGGLNVGGQEYYGNTTIMQPSAGAVCSLAESLRPQLQSIPEANGFMRAPLHDLPHITDSASFLRAVNLDPIWVFNRIKSVIDNASAVKEDNVQLKALLGGDKKLKAVVDENMMLKAENTNLRQLFEQSLRDIQATRHTHEQLDRIHQEKILLLFRQIERMQGGVDGPWPAPCENFNVEPRVHRAGAREDGSMSYAMTDTAGSSALTSDAKFAMMKLKSWRPGTGAVSDHSEAGFNEGDSWADASVKSGADTSIKSGGEIGESVGAKGLDPNARAFVPSPKKTTKAASFPVGDAGFPVGGAVFPVGYPVSAPPPELTIPVDTAVQSLTPRFFGICPFDLSSISGCPRAALMGGCHLQHLCRAYNDELGDGCKDQFCAFIHEHKSCEGNVDGRDCDWQGAKKGERKKRHFRSNVHKSGCSAKEWELRMIVANLREPHKAGLY